MIDLPLDPPPFSDPKRLPADVDLEDDTLYQNREVKDIASPQRVGIFFHGTFFLLLDVAACFYRLGKVDEVFASMFFCDCFRISSTSEIR